jgi:hypothetical protein
MTTHPMPRSAAYHEASHAVVTVLCGGTVTSADIICDGKRAGVCRFLMESELMRDLCVGLAGGVGQWLAMGREGDVSSFISGSDARELDADLAKHYKGAAPPRHRCREYQLALRVTIRLLSEFWGAVVHLTKRLLTHQKVSGPLAHAVVAAHKISLEDD